MKGHGRGGWRDLGSAGIIEAWPRTDREGETVSVPASITAAYEEVVDFLAQGPGPGRLIAFRPSQAARDRVADLIAREKTAGLSEDETAELDHYLQLEHLMRLAKARARQYVVHE